MVFYISVFIIYYIDKFWSKVISVLIEKVITLANKNVVYDIIYMIEDNNVTWEYVE